LRVREGARISFPAGKKTVVGVQPGNEATYPEGSPLEAHNNHEEEIYEMAGRARGDPADTPVYTKEYVEGTLESVRAKPLLIQKTFPITCKRKTSPNLPREGFFFTSRIHKEEGPYPYSQKASIVRSTDHGISLLPELYL